MTPENLDQWLDIFRDTVIVVLATFMLVYETVFADNINPCIVGAGLTLAGVPPALRLDTRRGRRRRSDTAMRDPSDPLDPYK